MTLRRLSAASAAFSLMTVMQTLGSITMAAEQGTVTVLIENISDDQTLKLANGETKRVPVAPGAYAVVNANSVLFEEGRPAGQRGLEALAEDGNAEPLIQFLERRQGVRQAGMFVPGQTFSVTAAPGDRLVFAAMFVESNDLFYSPGPEGIALLDAAGHVSAGDLSIQVKLWDAGTEVNEPPGLGPNQGPRQNAANTGPAEEGGVVRVVNDGFRYPGVSEVLRVTLEAD